MIELNQRQQQNITVATPEVSAMPEQVVAPAIEITDAARKQIARVLARRQQQDLPDAFLRVGVKGGGCSGLSYFMEPDTEFDDRDRTWVAEDGIRVVVDERSLQFLAGMTIDYDIKNLMEGGFVYQNPNAARSCGCGTSFTPK
jgi:iron-sulfur cluster assembly protein